MIDPPDEMPPDLAKSGEIEERLLGGARRHTRTQAAAFADVSPEYAQRLWRALGFANVGEGAAAPAEALRAAVDLSSDHLEEFEALLVYAWRRQLAAVAGRALAERDAEAVSGVLSVGFADLVSFTRLSQRLEERELAALVDRFGRRSADVIAGAGGRLVKTVGDEVLFVADSAARAARIGLELAETMAEDPVLPDVRVGIATGTVLTRMGDVFGRTVNLANRLTALAAPGTVLADRDTTEALASDPDFVLDAARTRAVRGMGLVRPGVVRRRR